MLGLTLQIENWPGEVCLSTFPNRALSPATPMLVLFSANMSVAEIDIGVDKLTLFPNKAWPDDTGTVTVPKSCLPMELVGVFVSDPKFADLKLLKLLVKILLPNPQTFMLADVLVVDDAVKDCVEWLSALLLTAPNWTLPPPISGLVLFPANMLVSETDIGVGKLLLFPKLWLDNPKV